MTISLCMIVKNESECLPRCLDAAAGLYDELIIVDTGSTDDTVEIAERYGARVLHYTMPEPGHLGAARNVGLDAATGDWIVVLDADEVLSDARGLRRFVADLPDEQVTAIALRFENYDAAGNVTIAWWQPRVWRRGLYAYVHRAHEVPVETVDPARLKQVALQIVVQHRPPPQREGSKVLPLLAMLEADVAERPTDRHSVYFLHRQYALAERWSECIEMGLRYLALGDGVDNHDAYGVLATAYMQTGQWQEAVNIVHRALATQPHRRIWWIRLAELYMQRDQWNVALAYLRGASELWPTWEWTTEVYNTTAGLQQLIDTCQRSLATLHHTH